MSNRPFPIGIWGSVLSAESGSRALGRVRVDRDATSGFIMITEEPTGTFDVWVETEAEVAEFLESIAIRWEQ
ncbi:hypothetical protein [Sorangium sp. So ce341]|uniref:hypothetical protein n=1 Tax=Sorangium sp. So ce341 TaxID=3133302 RepID=UPI003F644A16